MRHHWKLPCLLPYKVGRKMIERQKQNRSTYLLFFIIFSAVWYVYLSCQLILYGRILGIRITNGSIAMNKAGSFLIDVTKYGRQLKESVKYNVTEKNERIFHDMKKCFKAASSGNSIKEHLFIDRKVGSGFACDHVMVLGNKNLGRTGNQMFQVAALLGVASLHGYTAVIEPSMSITAWFDLPNVSSFKLNHSNRFRERSCCMYDRRAVNLSHAHNWTLHGYYQSWRYFDGANQIIRNAFKVKDVFNKEAADFIKGAITKDVIKVGVHVRRGDFTVVSQQKRGYSLAPFDFVQRAMLYFRKKYKHVRFFIVSDDKMWCDKSFKGTDVTVSPLTKTVGFDMAILTLCNHVIVTSGSFGWWGAFIAGGEVVYWKGFPGNGTWLYTQTNLDDYYPSTWIGL